MSENVPKAKLLTGEGGLRQPKEIELYLRMGAAGCYFTGFDIGFVQAGAQAAAARAGELDARFFGAGTGA
jgi:uncharacterized protein YneR